jgi:Lhr-like helicase
VIVDEVHAIAGSKRGARLALTLERPDCLVTRDDEGGDGADRRRPPQRIGISAASPASANVTGSRELTSARRAEFWPVAGDRRLRVRRQSGDVGPDRD